MNFFKNCGIIIIPDRGLKNLIFLPYWCKSTGLSVLCMEHYCEKNFLECGHRKKMYGNSNKVFLHRLYPLSLVIKNLLLHFTKKLVPTP